MAKEAGPNAQGVGGTALKLPQKVCPVETAEPLPGAQGRRPGAPQFRGQLRPSGWHWLTQGGHVLLLTGNQLRHQTLLGAAGTTRSDRGGCGMGGTCQQYHILFLRASWACLLGTSWAGLSPDASLALHPGGAYSPGPFWAPGPAQQHVFPG